ncbi:chemotaxis protein CheW [Geobacter sp.]|uniref:chemotaxis protein CheW n=1 Tax=Geobacter sp. TaxID=46610 RepID=UPI001AC433FA|nr:chemotaxis protein CheW [Geobacter sp.]CAG0969675.1 Chemotaxis protein CheW [Geobacteraceae bacterium]
METALQTRVEESRNELIQLVSFKLEHEEYGVNVLKVREIIRMPSITRVPNTPHYIEGVINLRGKVIPIISMRKRFNLPDGEISSQTRIMVIDMEGELMGFVVDAVSEVIRIAESEIQPPPAVVNSAVEQECLAGVINQTDRLLFFLNLEKLISRDERHLFSGMM